MAKPDLVTCIRRPTLSTRPIPSHISQSLRLTQSEPPELIEAILAGLTRSTAAADPSRFDYNFQFLSLRQVADLPPSSNTQPSGLAAHSGGSFIFISGVGFQSGLGEDERIAQALELLEEAERIGRERRCRGMGAFTFDFEKPVRRALDESGFKAMYVLPNWFDGSVGRTFMWKVLV